jgi:hypothetical protein
LLVEWIRTLPPEPLPTVASYRENFNDWMAQQVHLFPSEVQEAYFKWMVRDFFLAIRRNLLDTCETRNIQQDDWDSPEAMNAVDDSIDDALKLLGGCESMPGWENVDAEDLLQRYRTTIDEAREWVFDDTPMSTSGPLGLDKVVAALIPVFEDFSMDAVLAFVGFGSDEVFPAMDKGTYQGMIADRIRVGDGVETAITTEMDSSINPLGQTAAEHTIPRAYNSSFLTASHQRLEKFTAQVAEELAISDDQRGKLTTMEAAAHEAINSDFEKVSWEQYVQPMLNTVGSLPTAEVARMAEALVGLQVLRQLTQADAETVGGPIDVAIITRQDGFQWVRHKSLSIN